MKRFALVLAVGMCLFGFAAGLSAAQTGNVTVTFSVQNLSINLSNSVLAFGAVAPGASIIASSNVVVSNDGNGAETFIIKASSSQAFELVSSAPATNYQMRLLGVFNAAMPAIGDFDIANDFLMLGDRTSSATIFSGTETGENVPSGQARTLWVRLDTPTGNPAPGAQSVTVSITAVLP